ncbi:MAG TPA: hypothetical protein VIK89_03435 [Cytophagaceae bacterium]
MKNKLCLTVLMLSPAICFAGLLDGEKKYEFIGIVSFVSLTAIGLFVYYIVWKNNRSRNNEKYIYKTVEYVQNGKKYVKYKKLKVVEDPKANKGKSPVSKPAMPKAAIKPVR